MNEDDKILIEQSGGFPLTERQLHIIPKLSKDLLIEIIIASSPNANKAFIDAVGIELERRN